MRVATLGWVTLCLLIASMRPSAVQASQQPRLPSPFAATATADVAASPQDGRQLALWVIGSGDHQGLPFGIVDKRSAIIMLYAADGTLAGTSAVLLGQTLGDEIIAGVGERTQRQSLRAEDLTTPAGRFVSEPGRNSNGESVVWIDYGSAFAIHRLRDGASRQQRAERLASNDVRGRRMSAGCVVVPEAFYDAVVAPLLGRRRGLVYVMPESGVLPQGRWLLPQTRQLE